MTIIKASLPQWHTCQSVQHLSFCKARKNSHRQSDVAFNDPCKAFALILGWRPKMKRSRDIGCSITELSARIAQIDLFTRNRSVRLFTWLIMNYGCIWSGGRYGFKTWSNIVLLRSTCEQRAGRGSIIKMGVIDGQAISQ